MPHQFTVDAKARLLRLQYHGEVGVNERRQAVQQMMEAVVRTGLDRMLVDFRNAHSLPADPQDVVRVVNQFAPQVPPGARIAYLLRYDHQLDAAFEGFARQHGLSIERFMDLDAALGWLQAAAPSVPAQPGPTALPVTIAGIDQGRGLRDDQVAAIDDLVRACLASGMDEARVRELAARIAAVMDAPGR